LKRDLTVQLHKVVERPLSSPKPTLPQHVDGTSISPVFKQHLDIVRFVNIQRDAIVLDDEALDTNLRRLLFMKSK
jgi:hypothetical protein